MIRRPRLPITASAAVLIAGAATAAAADAENSLAQEISPHLREHASATIDWRQWGVEAFADAVEQTKLVFASIG